MAKKPKARKTVSTGRKAKPRAASKVTHRATSKAAPRAAARKPAPAKAEKPAPKPEPKPPAGEKGSFWSFLGIGKKAKPKVGLMQVKSK
jgi:hypothetical protein